MSRFKELFTVVIAGVIGVVLLIGAASLVSPNHRQSAAQAPAHQTKVKIEPAGGVDPDAQAAANPVRENPTGDEEEREATVPHPGATAASCGVERWSVKTGTDADASKITLQSTTSTTIAFLDGLAKPGSLPANNRIQPTDHRVQTPGHPGGVQAGVRFRLPPGAQ
ncbi:MAG TPA: hypothetical protein VH352_17610 [Pseudonocardiaceae bacterium]|jgi:hypothetical protein|nr:hypothetical protein [Pseudonocardiaceae bacterium]